MADQALVDLFLTDSAGWKKWRDGHPESGFDFREADFSGRKLRGAYLIGANCYAARFNDADLCDADLRGAYAWHASFKGATLSGAKMGEAGFVGCDFSNSVAKDAVIVESDISGSRFTDADLSGASLRGTRMVKTDFTRTNLSGCKVYGAAVWDVVLDHAQETDLVITAYQEPEITVDSLEVAQFLYLLLRNDRLRSVIDTITAKVVLLLGRFTPNEKRLLDELRSTLRSMNYLPVVFDFIKPGSRDMTETISTLAHLSRFVVAILDEPRSVPHELATIIPHLRSVPVQPLLRAGQQPYAMFDDLARYPTVLPTVHYHQDVDVRSLAQRVIVACEGRATELLPK